MPASQRRNGCLCYRVGQRFIKKTGTKRNKMKKCTRAKPENYSKYGFNEVKSLYDGELNMAGGFYLQRFNRFDKTRHKHPITFSKRKLTLSVLKHHFECPTNTRLDRISVSYMFHGFIENFPSKINIL